MAEAVRLDDKLRAVWPRHPRFTLVPHDQSFFKKIGFGLAVLEGMIVQINGCASKQWPSCSSRAPHIGR